MIVPMKKLTLVCLADDRDATLDALARLGALHLAPVQEPSGENLDRARRKLDRTTSALQVLQAREPAESGETPAPEHAPDDVVDQVLTLAEREKQLAEQITALREEQDAVARWGDFDPADVRALREKGVWVKLFVVTARPPLQAPPGAALTVLRQDGPVLYVAVAAASDFEFEGTEVPLPDRSLGAVTAEMRRAEQERAQVQRKLRELARFRESVEAHRAAAADRLAYVAAREGMGADRALAYLQGFCPADRVDSVRSRAADQGWGLVVEAPADDDPAPTLIRYPAWVRPIRPLFRFLGIVPGYRETDVSPAFFIFLSIFFAMIVGDAGYGALLLGFALAARRRWHRAPAEPFRLLAVFGAATLVWGALTGNYFGISSARLPDPLRALKVGWLDDQANSMTLCLLLGAVHLSVARAWNAFKIINTPRAIAQIGWICMTWTMFVASRRLLINAAVPGWFLPVPVAGLAAIVFFMTPLKRLKREWIGHALLVQDIIGNFGDLVSYLRLFALGIASLKVAEAFNQMAGMIGFGGVPQAAGAVLVLLLGHSLNLVLCAMSVLVHGVRLNALEFSLHMKQEWSGHEYRPFASLRAH